MMNPPNPFHPTRANAIRLIYAYIILVEDYIDHIGYIDHMGLSAETMVNTTKPEFPAPIHVEKTLKDYMKAAIELNAIYTLQERHNQRAESILAILTPVDINSLAPDEVDCTICSEPLGQEAFLGGAIELACQTPCNHIFGKRCITHWLKDNNTCPTYRSQLAITEGED